MNEKRRMGTLKDYKRNSGVLGALHIGQKIHNDARLLFKNTQSWLLNVHLIKPHFARQLMMQQQERPDLTNYGFMHFAVF